MTVEPKLWTRDFIFLAIANLLMAISFYFMLPILPVYLVDKLGATRGEIGIILAFYTIAALIIRLFAGWALDTYGRKIIYLSAYILFSILFIGYPMAFTILQFMFLRVLHGLTWGTLTTSGSTISVDLIPPKRRGEGIGIFGLSMTIGMALGPMIAIMITGESNYSALFLSAIGITALGLILALAIQFPKFKSHNSTRTLNLKGLIEKSAIPISLNMLLIMFTYGGLLSFIALYGKEIGVNSSGPFFLILSLGIGLSRVGSGRIFDKSGPAKISILGMILLIIGFPMLALLNNSLGFHLSAVVLGLGFGIIMPTYQAMINNLVTPTRRGAANSTFFTAFDLGIGIGMIGTGLLSQWLGFSITFIISSVLVFLALIFFLFISFNHYKTLLSRKDSIE
jgi:MFS family permease